MRQLGDRPLPGTALAGGDISESLAFTIADWARKLPAGMRTETDSILLEAATAGASLDDLAAIAACAIEQWRQQQPDPDSPDDAFEDRYVRVGTTFGGAGVIRGDLTPGCAAAVSAVLEALGKKAARKTTAPSTSGSATRSSWCVFSTRRRGVTACAGALGVPPHLCLLGAAVPQACVSISIHELLAGRGAAAGRAIARA
jgi:hypothetical protein